MSSARVKKISGIEKAPYIGALLRLAHQVARSRLLQALAERGMDDINEAYFGLFQYPPIDGMRPAALAKQLGVSKQAMNHLLGQLEKLGYLQRRRERENGHTAVHLTERGWLVVNRTSRPSASSKLTGSASLASGGSPTSRRRCKN